MNQEEVLMARKVLIQDGDRKFSEELSKHLQARGHAVARVPTALEAIRIFEAETGIGSIDAAVIDIDGFGGGVLLLHYLYTRFGAASRPLTVACSKEETSVRGRHEIALPEILSTLYEDTRFELKGEGTLENIAEFVGR